MMAFFFFLVVRQISFLICQERGGPKSPPAHYTPWGAITTLVRKNIMTDAHYAPPLPLLLP